MIALALDRIVEIVGGRLEGDGADVVVSGPVVIDGREAGPGGLFVAFVGEHADGHDHVSQAAGLGAVAVIGTRATELPTVVVDDPQAALQRLAAHVLAEVRGAGRLRVLALTGSQGKTTTKDLLGAILAGSAATVATRGSYNNELGVPLTVLRIETDTRFLVVEMGARGRGHLTELTDLVPPDVSVVLNVGRAHLGEFGSQQAIAEAKSELVSALGAGGTAVLNLDDQRVSAMRTLAPDRVLGFGIAGAQRGDSAPPEVQVEGLRLDALGRPRLTLVAGTDRAEVALRVVGAHQAANAAAAAAAALAVGVSLSTSASALSDVASLSQWRMELHELPGGVLLLDDSYNANPESVRAGLDALAAVGTAPAVRRTVAVLGEMLELGPAGEAAHREVGAYAASRIDHLLVVGVGARGIHDGAVDAGATSVAVRDNAAAIDWLHDHSRDGDAILVKASRGARLDQVAAAVREHRAGDES